MGENTVLSTENLEKKFGKFAAIDDVTWEVTSGQTKAIIGPNGAGKSTFFNLLSGIISPTNGSVQLQGIDITSSSPHEIANRGLIKTFQEANVYNELTVFENIQIAAQTSESPFNMWSRAENLSSVNSKADEILTEIGMDDKRDQKVDELSHGDQRKIEIGIALACDPDIILFDEPTAGMSEMGKEDVLELLTSLANDPSTTILITEHDIDLILNLAEEITVLNEGTILTEGSPDEIVNSEEVQRVYISE